MGYFYILFNRSYFILDDIMHSYEMIWMLEKQDMIMEREKLELGREIEEISRWM